MDHFFNENGITRKNLGGACIDGAPAMLGSKSGFRVLVQRKTSNVLFIHYLFFWGDLACRLQDVSHVTIKIVNFLKNSVLHSRLFRKLCKDMESEHINLRYYTKVRWLSKGDVVSRVFELCNKLKISLNDEKP